MPEEDNTWPQDKGQGVENSDFSDAASIAQALFNPALKDIVLEGLEFENLGNGTFDLTFGVAKLYVPTMWTRDRGFGKEYRDECLIAQQVAPRQNISYDGGGTTHVFLDVDLSKNNTVDVLVNDGNTTPSPPGFKIGVIDEESDAVTPVNRKPSVDLEAATIEDLSVLSSPSESNDAARFTDLVDASDSTGSTIQSPLMELRLGSNLSWTENEDGSLTLDTEDSVSVKAKQARSTHPIPISELADGDYVDYPLRVPTDKTVKVWKWGARTAAQSTPDGLTVGLYDYGAGNYVASSNTAHATGDPLASGSGAGDFALRLENTTGTTHNAGADFSATIQ